MSSHSLDVSIRNFQAISELDVSFPKGLTVITGETNNGKSSIFRAIEAAIYNVGGDSYIKAGEKFTGVKIRYQGNEVIWKKNKKYKIPTSYKINGEVLGRVGKKQPAEVAQALRMEDVNLLRAKERLNFWRQMSLPFLQDRSPSQLFEFLTRNEDHNLFEVLAAIKEEIKLNSLEISKVEGAIDSLINQEVVLQRTLSAFEGFSDVRDKVLDLESNVLKISHFQSVFANYRAKCFQVKSIQESVDKIRGISAVFPVFPQVERSLSVVSQLESLLKKYQNYQEKIQEFKEKCQAIDFPDLDVKEKEIKTLYKKREGIEKKRKAVESYWKISKKIEKNQDSLTRCKDLLQGVIEEYGRFDSCPLCGSVLSTKGE